MKLIAFDITNLTDARYFAARGAHTIGFSTVISSIEEVNAMKDWVDVPEFFLRLPADPDPEFIWEWQQRTGIDQFLIENLSDDTKALFSSAKWIKFIDSVESYDIDTLSYIFVRASNLVRLNELNNSSATAFENTSLYLLPDTGLNFNEHAEGMDLIKGVLIAGSDEDEVGVKSFDLVDDFLESLAIEY